MSLIRLWFNRYLPPELIAIPSALLAANIVMLLTKNYLLAAYAGSFGENIGYYSFILVRDLYNAKKNNNDFKEKSNFFIFKTQLTGLIVEFGMPELFDTLLVRPALMYVIPLLLISYNLGLFLAKLFADVIFISFAMLGYKYRKIKGLL